jgi:predicted 3-demethylubiquinone-9 3-methyltransferase (glyoxalase superfamily)
MVASVQPFLMFQGNAEEALTFYTALIPDSRIEAISRYGAGEAGPEGTVMEARFTLAGQSVICIDSPVQHDFTFTPSFSFFVLCSDDVEIRRLASALLYGGEALMPLDNYGFSKLFAWVKDRFGVSWQLSLP